MVVKTDHLGNVVVTISDKKIAVDNEPDGVIDYYTADVTSWYDYFAFGSILPGRSSNPDEYRFGFNGMEKDDEITGQVGSHYTAEFWEYDSRIGKRWNIDPAFKKYPGISPFSAFFNNPIWIMDPTGAEGDESNDDDNIKISDLPKAENVGEFLSKAIDVIEPGQIITGKELKTFIKPDPEKEGEKQIGNILDKIESIEATENKEGVLELDVQFKKNISKVQETFTFKDPNDKEDEGTEIDLTIKSGAKIILQKIDAQQVAIKIKGASIGYGWFSVGSGAGKVTINKDKLQKITVLRIIDIDQNQTIELPKQFKKE